ncbi:Serine-rich protein-related [Quillaja saponaria]|uniref:Serine-rich protein-related n=1 Tax=Quillaja saponaria TaxID=32244 RepID=A0AAD7L6U9_QUISA|nr:Serine-rich protein-related [Quillaja saponaria]
MASSSSSSSSRTKSYTSGFFACQRSVPSLKRSYSSSSAFASSSSSFSYRSSPFLPRSSSPTGVNLYQNHSSSAVRFSIDRPSSPGHSISVIKQNNNAVSSNKKKCMCSPTTHPGSFRCSLHKGRSDSHGQNPTTSYHSSSSLNLRRSAMMTNSLVRIGVVEGDLMKRALSALIRPSSHQQRRRAAFQPRPSRLSIMSKAEDL